MAINRDPWEHTDIIFITSDPDHAAEVWAAVPEIMVRAPGHDTSVARCVILDGALPVDHAARHWAPRLAVACWTAADRERWAGDFWALLGDRPKGAWLVNAPADLACVASWMSVPA